MKQLIDTSAGKLLTEVVRYPKYGRIVTLILFADDGREKQDQSWLEKGTDRRPLPQFIEGTFGLPNDEAERVAGEVLRAPATSRTRTQERRGRLAATAIFTLPGLASRD